MSDYKVIKLAEYTAPVVVETRNKEWIEYRSSDRDYDYPNGHYQYLLDRAKYSTTNGSVISGFCRFIYGEGLTAKQAATRSEEFIKVKGLIKPKDLQRAIKDYKKLMMCSFQVTKERGEVVSITHFPMKTLLPEKMNEDGEVQAWYYHPEWDNATKVRSNPPERIPAFGFGSDNGNEIYVLKQYDGDSEYFGCEEGYTGCIPYAVLEEEIADFQVNDAQNGFTPTTILNFNNGIPDADTRKEIERDIYRKTTGATGKKVILAFNDDETKRTTVEKVAMDDAPDHYQYLSEEAERKILAGHRAPSELLGFKNDASGFANNAEELKNKLRAFLEFEVQPYQMDFIDALTEILAVNGIALDLYFKTLAPLDFGVKETVETTLKKEEMDFTDEDGDVMLELLEGERIDDEWVLADVREFDQNNDYLDWISQHVKKKPSLLEKLARVVRSGPSKESRLDDDIYKIRYTYKQKYSSGRSRSFCRQMMARTDKGVVYRLEDINRASAQGVNRSFGHKGRNYSLLIYKGGPNCGHYWQEELYRLKKKTDGSFYEDKSLASSEQVNSIPKENYKGDEVDPRFDIAPKDLPGNGYHPSNPRY